MRMTPKKKIPLIGLGLVFSVLVILDTYLIAVDKATEDIRKTGEGQLQIIALNLESVLEKFETLPFALGYQTEVAEALANPNDPAAINRLNLTLQSIQTQAKVSALYLMNRNGDTLGSSNWDQPLSFVGKNFAYRPYFQEALRGKAGRFYGIGSATNEPGYFIAQPVYRRGTRHDTATPIGVMAVKISLSEFEQTWQKSEDPIALVDGSGVVFLSNFGNWRYHSIKPLDASEQNDLAGTLQYAGRSIRPITSLPPQDRTRFGDFVSQPVGRLGWQLMLFPSQAHIHQTAAYWAAASALILAIAAISLWAGYQRRRRLEERSESRKALQAAAEELDRKIADRTEALLQANRNLETKYAKLKETEHLLRSTQNELVQAGKLAMLGQMAAGITHELNQPLAAIRAFADNAVTFLSRAQPDKAQENLSNISAASARMGSIISQLKGFARKSHETISTVDLAQSMHTSALLVESEFHRHDVELAIDVRMPLHVLGDTVRTEQVLINLMRNACDAVAQAPVRKVSATLDRDGTEAVLRIRDSGAGIPEDVAQHLFEPFFTTKSSGNGLGLGLAISSSIVQAMNGRLEAHNHEQGGAEFILRLPLTAQETRRLEGESLVGT